MSQPAKQTPINPAAVPTEAIKKVKKVYKLNRLKHEVKTRSHFCPFASHSEVNAVCVLTTE